MSEGYREMLFGLSGLKQDQQAGTAAVLSFSLIRDVSGALIVSMDNGAQAMQLELREPDVDRLRTALDCAQPAAIPLSKRLPGPDDKDGILVWCGSKAPGLPYWEWCLDDIHGFCSSGYTHWLPASVQFLPARVEE